VALRRDRRDHEAVNMPARETHLFCDPVASKRRFWHVQRWVVFTGLVLVAVLVMVGGSMVTLVKGALKVSNQRGTLKAWAVDAMPADARGVVSGNYGLTTAYAIGDVALTPTEVVSLFGPRWGGERWFEIPRSATPTSRSYLSKEQNRLLDVTAEPCVRTRPTCPPGGSTVTIEVAVGGPKS
jgi:hypothetical protein